MTPSARDTATNGDGNSAKPDRRAVVGLTAVTVMQVLDLSMVRVAIPSIRSAFDARADMAAWIATSYILPYAVLTSLYGWMGDELGRRRLLLASVIISSVGACLSGLVPSLPLLIVGRLVQGMGAAGIFPLAMAMVSELFPANQRGRALGIWNSITGFTSVLGTLVAGPLVQELGWRSIFAVVMLVSILAIVLLRRLAPTPQDKAPLSALRNFDWGGVVLLGMAVTSFLIYLSSEPITGVPPLRDWRALVTTVLVFAGFILWERRSAHPFVSAGTFNHGGFGQASCGAGLREYVMGSLAFLMPLYLTDIRGLSAAPTGLLLTIQACALLATMQLGGRLADRLGSRRPAALGMALQAGGMVYLALLPSTAPLGMVISGMVAHGFSAGLALAALQAAAMRHVPRASLGAAAGVYRMIGVSGMVFGTTLSGAILQQGLNRTAAPVGAYHSVFWVIALAAFMSAAVGATLRG